MGVIRDNRYKCKGYNATYREESDSRVPARCSPQYKPPAPNPPPGRRRQHQRLQQYDRSKRRERTRRSDDLIERADSSAHPVFAGRQRDRVLTKVVDIDVEGNGRMDGTVDVAGREIDQGQGQEGHGQQGPAGAAERGSGNEQHD